MKCQIILSETWLLLLLLLLPFLFLKKMHIYLSQTLNFSLLLNSPCERRSWEAHRFQPCLLSRCTSWAQHQGNKRGMRAELDWRLSVFNNRHYLRSKGFLVHAQGTAGTSFCKNRKETTVSSARLKTNKQNAHTHAQTQKPTTTTTKKP